MNKLKTGDSLMCVFGHSFPDKTTPGKIYEVVSVNNTSFSIVNDEGLLSMPIESTFRKVEN